MVLNITPDNIFIYLKQSKMANLPKVGLLNLFDDQNMDPKYNGYNLTNRVLVQITKSGKQVNKQTLAYYIPAYLRVKVKNFSQMSLKDLSATINTVINLTINFEGIPTYITDQIRKRLVLRFNRNDPLMLGQQSQQTSARKEGDQQIYTYVIRNLLNAGIIANIFLTPFQTINLILSIKLQKIHIDKSIIYSMISEKKNRLTEIQQEIQQIIQTSNKSIQMDSTYDQLREQEADLNHQINQLKRYKHIVVEFNLMDFDDTSDAKNTYAKISYSEEGTFGDYDLAQTKLRAQYTNQQLSPEVQVKKQGSLEDFSKIKCYQFAHFLIPLYKFPTVTLLTIFIPLWLLGILNLGVFFQDSNLADRIGSLSALMIAFVALIPVIREALPPNPNITFVQILVYMETITTLFCFIESIMVREINPDEYTFDWTQSGLFLASVVIGLFEFVVIAFLYLLHKLYWENSYNRHIQNMGSIKFNYREWGNEECDKHFRRKIDCGQIKILSKLNAKQKNDKDMGKSRKIK